MGRASIDLYNDQVLVYALKNAYDWWDEVNDSVISQDWIFCVLAALYGVVSVVALVSLKLTLFVMICDGFLFECLYWFWLTVDISGVIVRVFFLDVYNVVFELVYAVKLKKIQVWMI
ncbi:hypothetical protein HanOQP8_Chr12g0442841 [Helianthus annuus]|nr:hypothetical protein HanOQP8_Chr12g0442841 [Helianthus annuus]